jgi:hypothetical protein
MVQVFLARGSVIGIVHANIPSRFTTRTAFFEVLTIAAFKDVHLWEVDAWIIVVIESTILRTQVLCAEKNGYVDECELRIQKRAYKVGARLALNSQWKIRICFGSPSPLTQGTGLLAVTPRKYSSSCAVVLMLIAPGIWPPLYS